MRKIKHIKILVFIVLIFFVSACDELLDKENLTAVNPSDVFTNPLVASAYINNIYAGSMPGNPSGTGNSTDEGVPDARRTDSWLLGTATFDSYNIFSVYNNIREINKFLDNIDGASFDETTLNQFKGQALFWRAWSYYRLVKSYGGVPLILNAQEPTSDLSELTMPRSKTSVCVEQILKDLDDAFDLLPEEWTGEDVGRIDKGVILAFKGRVLLFFASPLFDGLGGVASWQKAYDANKDAKEFLEGKGKGLYASYKDIWDVELNREVIMVRRFQFPQASYGQNGIRPLTFASGAAGVDKPSLELVNAFPMKDGSSWDSETMSLDTLWRHRDDRFYANICYNGTPNQYIKDMREQNTYMWTYFSNIIEVNGPSGTQGLYNPITDENGHWSLSSFHRIKAVDKNKSVDEQGQCDVDWPEIRFTEVLMNFGECANEINKSDEALDVLKQVRARAGILEGDGSYGITAATQEEIREAYLKERFVEFCFEGKRMDDLRRRKQFGYLRQLGMRHGIALELKEGETHVKPMDDIDEVYTKFNLYIVNADDGNIVIKDQFYIYGIPKTVLDRNEKLEQNINWGGEFDPMQ